MSGVVRCARKLKKVRRGGKMNIRTRRHDAQKPWFLAGAITGLPPPGSSTRAADEALLVCERHVGPIHRWARLYLEPDGRLDDRDVLTRPEAWTALDESKDGKRAK